MTKLLAALLLHCIVCIQCGPVPIIDEQSLAKEEGLILLVPSVDAKNPQSQQVEYELISIPKEVIRRTVREVTRAHARSGTAANKIEEENNSITSIFVADANSEKEGEEILLERLPSISQLNDRDVNLKGSASGSSYSSQMSDRDLFSLLSGILTAGVSTNYDNANSITSSIASVGQSALTSGTQILRWILTQKANALRKVANLSSSSFEYVGRLTSSLLKILLRVPAIKVRVFSEVLQAGQPLVTALTEVIGDSADDIGEILSSQASIFRDALGIIFRLISDILAIKGRIFAGLTGNGLEKGATLINAGVRVGSALVSSGGQVASAVGKGVRDVVQVISDANIPPLPALPVINLPSLAVDSKESYGPPRSY